MSPFDLFFCWQAALLAVVVSGLTQLVKTAVDLRLGKDRRKRSRVLTRLVLPMVPIWLGAGIAMVVPMRPEVLTSYVAEHAQGWQSYVIFAFWGGGCGTFCDYAFTKVKAWMTHSTGGGDMGAPVER